VRAYAIGALEKLDSTGDWRQNLIHESFVSGGNFIMGITPGNFIDESYEHYVEVEGFYISRSPVTFENYHRFMKSKEEPDDFIPGLERHPKVDLTWFEAIEYAYWANSRLPSEAEWEKAASWLSPAISPNPKKRRYPWGDQFIENNCNMSTSKINRTTPVGKYSPRGDSGYGCMDMAGNVWEWTNTIYRPYPYLISDGREVNTTVGSRVIRGGSYQSGPSYVTCTVRQAFNPYSKRKDIGLRCVLVIPDADQW
jgi:formylglycine-generating enzyme required for sulfatase activity